MSAGEGRRRRCTLSDHFPLLLRRGTDSAIPAGFQNMRLISYHSLTGNHNSKPTPLPEEAGLHHASALPMHARNPPAVKKTCRPQNLSGTAGGT